MFKAVSHPWRTHLSFHAFITSRVNYCNAYFWAFQLNWSQSQKRARISLSGWPLDVGDKTTSFSAYVKPANRVCTAWSSLSVQPLVYSLWLNSDLNRMLISEVYKVHESCLSGSTSIKKIKTVLFCFSRFWMTKVYFYAIETSACQNDSLLFEKFVFLCLTKNSILFWNNKNRF